MPRSIPSHTRPVYRRRLLAAGLALAGAGLFAGTAPHDSGVPVQAIAVRLATTEVGGEVDWATFIENLNANLATNASQSATANADLSSALTNVSDHFNTQISTAITGFDTGINNALFGGWYGGDDGYVFGLFGGEPVAGPNGATETGSLLATLSADLSNISGTNGSEQFYSDLNNYELELLDHTAKPLLAPLLNETVKVGGVVETNYSIPSELSTIQTNLINTFGTYTELKDFAQAVLAPGISANFALTSDLDDISAAFQTGDSATAMTDLNNLSSDVLNAYVNGINLGTNPQDGAAELFPGLLGDGSLATQVGDGSFFNELNTVWIPQFITALGSLADPVTSGTAESVGSSAPDLLASLFGGL